MSIQNNVIGINFALTKNGIKLDDGSVAIVQNGKVKLAICEERISRRKYDTSWEKSLDYCMYALNLKISDISKVVFSNCCDTVLNHNEILKYTRLFPRKKIQICPSHHLSHACCVAYLSTYDNNAMILVSDNEGNILSSKFSDEYWSEPLERVSIYEFKNGIIKLVTRLFNQPNNLGPGAVYNFFTHWLGFSSYHYAGKTMALASFGKREIFDDIRLFEKNSNGEWYCNMENLHIQKAKAVINFFKKYGIDIGPARKENEPIEQIHKDIAAYIQNEIEKITIEIIKAHSLKEGNNWCLSGGVALNCVLNAKIAELDQVLDLYVDPMASDIGQSIGNALWGYFGNQKKEPENTITLPYFGRNYSNSDYQKALEYVKAKIDCKITYLNPIYVAKELADEKVIATCIGSSEMGLRALGNRSILAAPFKNELKVRVSEVIKGREGFRPIAPIAIESCIDKYFITTGDTCLMTIIAMVRREWKESLKAITHVDGSSRLQSLKRENNSVVYDVLYEFGKITRFPILINTSFNLKNEPIVETPKEAVDTIINSDIDGMILGNYFIIKNKKI